jgi:hypothetical protein
MGVIWAWAKRGLVVGWAWARHWLASPMDGLRMGYAWVGHGLYCVCALHGLSWTYLVWVSHVLVWHGQGWGVEGPGMGWARFGQSMAWLWMCWPGHVLFWVRGVLGMSSSRDGLGCAWAMVSKCWAWYVLVWAWSGTEYGLHNCWVGHGLIWTWDGHCVV